MRHDWIIEVLEDLRAYAAHNDLPALAAQTEETLRVARAEIAAPPLSECKPTPDRNAPPRSH